VVVASVGAGVIVSIGVVATVLSGIGVVSVEVAGVVALSVVSAGDAGGVATSVFCSHAARSAALARMLIYFFIGYG
jgi:hypothetical protein